MQLDRASTLRIAALAAILILTIGFLVSRPAGPVLAGASLNLDHITPNADGREDATRISYRIRRDAAISVYFTDGDGNRYDFRRDEPRSRGDYEVLFSGIVDPYQVEGEVTKGTILQRLMPDGEYTWVIEAVDQATGRTDQVTGELMVSEGDPVLPDLDEFSVSPSIFTPNQDGIADRVWINAAVPKPARLRVALIDPEGRRIFIPETQGMRDPGDEGRHLFEYDGGIDNGSDPPPDGTYTVLVEAEDDEGQRVEMRSELTIEFGGVPLAEIAAQPVGDTVEFSSELVHQGDILTFQLTVVNYGDAPIRTTGPAPGYIYEQDNLYTTTGYDEESGAWRVGIMCQTSLSDYPWRWALGSVEELTPIEGDERVHYYLMPGQRAIITGGIRLTEINETKNPQYCWAGLIHEDVDIAAINNRVDPHWIEIIPEELQGAGN